MEVFLFSFSFLDSVMNGKRSSAREDKRFSVYLLPPAYMHPIFLVSLFSFYRRVRGMIHLVTSLYPNIYETCLIFRTGNSVSNTIIFSVLRSGKITGLLRLLFAFLDRASRLCVFVLLSILPCFIYIEVHLNASNFACFQLSIHGFSFHIIGDWKIQCNQTSHPWLLLTPSMFIHRHKPFKTGFDRIYGSYASKKFFLYKYIKRKIFLKIYFLPWNIKTI